MKTYTSTAVMRFGQGDVIGLNAKQAAARAGSLRAVPNKKGLFQVLAAVEFKAGEAVELAEVPKRLRDAVAEVEGGRKGIPRPPEPGTTT